MNYQKILIFTGIACISTFSVGVADDSALKEIEQILISRHQVKARNVVNQFLERQSDMDLEELLKKEYLSIALHAAYFSSQKYTSSDSTFSKSFTNKIDKVLAAKCPPWFRVVIGTKVSDDGRQFYDSKCIALSPRARASFSTAELYLEFDYKTESLSVFRNNGHSTVYSHNAAISPSGLAVSGVENESSTFACVYSDMSQGGQKVCCIDKETNQLNWIVTSRESDVFGNGHTTHHLSMVPTENHLIIFGTFSGTVYIDVLDIKSGNVVGRFSSLVDSH